MPDSDSDQLNFVQGLIPIFVESNVFRIELFKQKENLSVSSLYFDF